jgi:hypothetical protein
MDDSNLMHEDLPTMLMVIGSYLYGGGDIQEIDHIILDRVSELIDKHLDGVTENMSVH